MQMQMQMQEPQRSKSVDLVYWAHEPRKHTVMVYGAFDGSYFVWVEDTQGEPIVEREYQSWRPAYEAVRPFLKQGA